jgi:hypothetical protein
VTIEIAHHTHESSLAVLSDSDLELTPEVLILSEASTADGSEVCDADEQRKWSVR